MTGVLDKALLIAPARWLGKRKVGFSKCSFMDGSCCLSFYEQVRLSTWMIKLSAPPKEPTLGVKTAWTVYKFILVTWLQVAVFDMGVLRRVTGRQK